MDLILWLSITAGLMHVVAFVLYNKQMLQGTSYPNAATWTLWVFLTVLNATSYIAMSNDLVKSILPMASSVACILTFLLSLFKGKLSRIDPHDGIALIIGIISGFVWWHYKSATYANLVLQFSILISFVPTYRGVWNNPANEKALPWYIWSLAYVLAIAVIFLRWKGQYQDLAYPVNCLILHAVVAVLANRRIATQ